MPLSKKRMRERKQQDRVKPMSNLNDNSSVKPNMDIPGLKIEGNRIIGIEPRFDKQDVKPNYPRYNPNIHKPGDTVLVLRGKRWLPYLIPEVDGSGQAVPDYY